MRLLALVFLCLAGGGSSSSNGSADVAELADGRELSAGFVRKTVFSNSSRMIVALGLEGTGHHFFVAMLSRRRPDGSKPTGCSFNSGLACMLDLPGNWNQWNLERQVRDSLMHKDSQYGPVGAGWSPQYVQENAKKLRSLFEKNPGWIVAPNPYTTSWPNGHGTHEMRKSHMGPNILLLAQAAEFAGVDMRVIPMHRDAAELLLADCRHRHDLERCPQQAETLATNARAYADQMRQLDPAFYAGNCIQYANLDNMTRGIRHALQFSAATFGVDVAEAVRGAWQDKHRDPNEPHEPEILRMSAPIRPPLEEVLALCAVAAAGALAPAAPVASSASLPQSFMAPPAPAPAPSSVAAPPALPVAQVAAVGASPPAGPDRIEVRKTVFSNVTRMIVPVGLEGTGHHFFVALLSRKKDGEKPRTRSTICNTGMGLACTFNLPGNWNQWSLEAQVRSETVHQPSKYGPVGAGWSERFVQENANALREAVEKNPGWIVAPNPYSTSWPNGHGTHEMRMKHMGPNILLLARAAELAGIDMRLIPMHRDAGQLLLADCRHRPDLEKCPPQAETLAENARAYAGQMKRIDPAFYAGNCIRYGDLDNVSNGIRHALSGSQATLGQDIDVAVRGAFINKHRDAHEAEQEEVLRWAADIRPPLQEVVDLCIAADSMLPTPPMLPGASPAAKAVRGSVPVALGVPPTLAAWRVLCGAVLASYVTVAIVSRKFCARTIPIETMHL